jgi:FG-GAP-like repeat/FG-GAP repeat
MGRRFQGRRWSGVFDGPRCMVLLACLGAALTLGFVAPSAAGSAPSFAAARNYAVGRGPISVAIGDLNGDGKPDLATANSGARTASVLLGRGGGNFEPKRDLAIAGAGGFAVGDLNGDGRPDLATVSSGTPITASVFLNSGDSGFEPRRDYPGTINGVPSAIAIGDFNGDGKPDLVATDAAGGRVAVFLNKGDGSFFAKGVYKAGSPASTVATGDLNADGRSDLVTANTLGPNTVSVVMNRGDASFLAPRVYHTTPEGVAIGDLNGDGKPDLVIANDDPAVSVSVFLNRGDGSFRARRDYKTGSAPGSAAIGDLNGDGKPDLATANDGGTVSVLENRGGGSFQAGLDYRAPGKIPVAIAIGDLNGDGRRDLVTANRDSNTVSVLLNTPGLCTVQDVKGETLAAAKRTIARAYCRLGKVRGAYSKWFRKGRVISETPKPLAVLGKGGKVNLVVSRGRKK